MLLQDGFRDGQAQPRADAAAVLPCAVVAVKDIGQILGRDAWAVVLDFDAAALFLRDGPQHDNAVRADVVERVAQQVVHDPLHHGRVGADGAGVIGLQVKLPVVFVAQSVVAARYFKAKLAHVKVYKIRLFRATLHFAQLHNAVDQRGQAVCLIHNNVALLGALGVVAARQIAHRLGVALYQGQRRAQVVADVGQNVFFQLGAALDLGGHVVEILCQTPDFIAVLHLNLYIVVARGDLLRAVGQLADGAGEPTAEKHGKQQVQHQQNQRHGAQNRAQHLGSRCNLGKACRDDDAVLPVGGKPTDAHLHRGTDFYDLVKRAVLKQLLPQLDGHVGVQIVAEIPAECARALMQKAGVHALVGFQAAQRCVGKINAAAIHVDFFVLEGLADAAPERIVQCQAQVAAVRDGRVRLVNQRRDGCGLAVELGADVAVVLRLQRIGDDAPHQPQRDQRDAADEQHQLAADAQREAAAFGAFCPVALFHTASGSNLYPMPHTVTIILRQEPRWPRSILMWVSTVRSSP